MQSAIQPDKARQVLGWNYLIFDLNIQNIYLPKFSAVTTTAFLSGMTRFDLSDVAINNRVINIRKFVAPPSLFNVQ